MLRSHPRPSVGDWIFIYSKSCNICMSGFDSPPHIESISLLDYALYNNSRHFCSSFVRFWDREAYQWRLVPHKCLGDLATSRTNQVAQLWPGNQSSQSQCPAVTLLPWHGTATCATMIISQQPPVTALISACLLRSKNWLWLQRMSFFVKW